jgi:hypothetical protein
VSIAETGFLPATPASATVTLAAGGRYAARGRGPPADLVARRASVAQAVERALDRDMAEKIRTG